MSTLQEMLQTEILAAFLIHKLRKQGFGLSGLGKEHIKEKLLTSELETSSLVLEDEDIDSSKSTNLSTDQISLEFTDEDIDSIGDKAEDVTQDFIDTAAEALLTEIKRIAPTMLKEQWREQQGFEKRLRERWKRPLDLLDLFISIATEAGSDFNSEFRNDAACSGDAVFEAHTRLHARACQVSSEILILLRSGYADGAHARWRTLHEIAVVGYAIGEHGQELAERYLLHDIIQVYKSARHYQKYHARISYEPLSQQEFQDIKSECDKLVHRFGKPFKSDYGWAASVIGSDRPRFSDIEEHVALDHMRPYYRMASDNVHANTHGAYHRLGLSTQGQDRVLLAGPSNMGLADPGHATAISLSQITIALLTTRSTVANVVILKILQELEDEIGKTFLKVHDELESLVEEA